MKLKKFHSILESTPEETKEAVSLSMDILERIHELLDEKFQGKQKLLAEKLGKSEAEVSKWLSGVQNFTIKTLTKLQVAFGEPIIAVCTESNDSTFVQAKIPYKTFHARMIVDGKGELEEMKTLYDDIKSSSVKYISKSDLLI